MGYVDVVYCHYELYRIKDFTLLRQINFSILLQFLKFIISVRCAPFTAHPPGTRKCYVVAFCSNIKKLNFASVLVFCMICITNTSSPSSTDQLVHVKWTETIQCGGNWILKYYLDEYQISWKYNGFLSKMFNLLWFSILT